MLRAIYWLSSGGPLVPGGSVNADGRIYSMNGSAKMLSTNYATFFLFFSFSFSFSLASFFFFYNCYWVFFKKSVLS